MAVFGGVFQQIHQHPLHQYRIELHQRQIDGNHGFHFHRAKRMLCLANRAADDLRHFDEAGAQCGGIGVFVGLDNDLAISVRNETLGTNASQTCTLWKSAIFPVTAQHLKGIGKC